MSAEPVHTGATAAVVLQDAGVGRAVQDLQAAQQQARAAQQEARAAQLEAQAAQREAAREAAQAGRDAAEAGRQAAAQARLEAQRAIAEARNEMIRVRRQGQPEIIVRDLPPGMPDIPQGAVIMAVAFFVMCAVIAIGFPIARAIARRMDRRSASPPAADADTRNRLERIEQAVDAIAVEVERISEGQRFTTKLLAEVRGLPHSDAAAVSERLAGRAAVPVGRAGDARSP